MNGNLDEAYFFLREGEFEKARHLFSQLLDQNPDNLDWINSYFIASYWDNKIDHLMSLREGKDRGKAILRYLDDFENEIINRRIPREEAYTATLQCVLEEASHHLGISFRLEGWNGVDGETLRGLVICFIRLGNFAKALELLEYSGNLDHQSSDLSFLRAECLIGVGRLDEGKELYKRAFLDDPTRFRSENIIWEPIKIHLERLRRSGVDQEYISHLLPVSCQLAGVFANSIPATNSDLDYYLNQLQRLQDSKNNIQGKFANKLNLKIVMIGSVVLEKFSDKVYPQEISFVRKILADSKEAINDLLLL
ncbi:tetratricopeptide repeat protein [Leptospira sp. GIMC2001]|uniref:tetratricopeptide repeat protein n=1 Tax=Leptospira sp. GIMC2001 TaxID=1513297 RepID=UPI0023492B38|nr:tetratricopeptide repeat protein [Leptospira sp. GIMC2001]WCL50479.1 tetratricopeptide repeat protein [Leptospira sp. GIMC2001]